MSDVKEELAWYKDAVCIGATKLFFPPSLATESTRTRERREQEAVLLCRSCPVMAKCRIYGRTNGELGIWGGETESQRWRGGHLDDSPSFNRKRQTERYKAKRELLKNESMIPIVGGRQNLLALNESELVEY